MSIRSKWIGPEGGAWERVGLAFEGLGFRRPAPDAGSAEAGAYALNIANQYRGDMDEPTALAVIRHAIETHPELLRHGDHSLREIRDMYAE